MRKNILALAFMVMLASVTVFADGETGHGNRVSEPVTANQTYSSNTVIDQFINAVYSLFA